MSFRFVDAHLHCWDPRLLSYPWLAAVPTIASAHTPAELQAEAGTLQPEKMVFVECGAPWLDEVRWIERLAASDRRLGGIVAKCAVNEGAVTIAAIAELKNHPLVRGVRHLIQHEADSNFCAGPGFIDGVREVGRAGLSFDICCFPMQLPAVIRLVRACPGTRFVLDHLGKPEIRAGRLDPWRGHIRELAALPNVVAKLSGLITEADHSSWKPDELRPYVDHALEFFGAERLLFGGDWPVAKLAGSYSRWLEVARELVSHLSATDQDAIFRDNAFRFYRLE